MDTTPPPFGRNLIVAIAVGVLAPFTLLAWPFAIATGIVIGTADVEKTLGLTAMIGPVGLAGQKVIAPVAAVSRSV